MAMRSVSVPVDDLRLGRPLEKKAWFMGRFIISNPHISFDSLLRHLDSRNEVETVLRLSSKGLSWGRQGVSWWRPWHRTLPFSLVELSALHDVFQEISRPQVLICVESPIAGVRDSNYQVVTFRLYDIDDVGRFQRLFQLLRNPDVVGLNHGERSPPTARLAVRPSHPEAESRTERVYGDRVRHGSRNRNRNSVAFQDSNNNNDRKTENADRTPAGNQLMIRSMSDPVSTTSRTEYHSPQPIRRNVAAHETGAVVRHQVMVETAPIDAVAAARTERGRPVPATRGSKAISKSWSDDEDAKAAALDLTWTRNSLFSDKVGAHRDGGVLYHAAEGGEPPKPKPRTKINNHQERTITPSQMKNDVTPERTVTPRQMKIYVTPERTVTPSQLKSYATPERTVTPSQMKSNATPERTLTPTNMRSGIGSSDDASERTVTPTQMRNQIELERTISPTNAHRQIPQTIEMAPVPGSPGLVRVYVQDYAIHQSPVLPQKSLLKSKKDLDPTSPDQLATTAVVDSGRQKKSLSFNPSVVVNGTTGNSLSESESPDEPGLDVTIHRIGQHRHASDSSNADGPDDRSVARNGAMTRGLSLPNGTPASFVPSSPVRIRSTKADPRTADSRPHAWRNGGHGSGDDNDHTPFDRREQVPEKSRRARIVPSGSIPVDVITEEEDRRYDRRPGPLQSTTTTQAVTVHAPDQTKGDKKGNQIGTAISSKGHRRMAHFGRRSDEPPLQYASDTEEWARSRSNAHILQGQDARRGVQVLHHTRSPIVVGGGHPSVAEQSTVTPNGRLEVRISRMRREDERETTALMGGLERGKEIGRDDVRKGRAAQVREGRRNEVDDDIRRVPVTHGRQSDPVGRLVYFSRSQSVFDTRRGPPQVIYHTDVAPPNGHQPGQQFIRSSSAPKPILLSRTASKEDGTFPPTQTALTVGKPPDGWHQSNGSKKISRSHLYDPTTMQLYSGGVPVRHKRKSNYF